MTQQVELKTSKGDIRIELDEAKAPSRRATSWST